MIHYRYDDILTTESDAFVIPVNCVGVMGAGLALQAAQYFPSIAQQYRELCRDGAMIPGHPAAISGFSPEQPSQQCILFPTKDHWRNPSELRMVSSGLQNLRAYVRAHPKVKSIDVPALGCGLGGLPWHSVEHLILSYLGVGVRRTALEVWVYPPVVSNIKQA